MDGEECFGLGRAATRRPVLGRAVADVGFSPALCQARESGLSPMEPCFPCLRRPGLEELPMGAGCDGLPTVNLKSRVHGERTPRHAHPPARLPEPRSSGTTSPWRPP